MRIIVATLFYFLVITIHAATTVEGFVNQQNKNDHWNDNKKNSNRLGRGGFVTTTTTTTTTSATISLDRLTTTKTTTTLNAQGTPPSEEDLERFTSYGESSRKFRRSYFTHSDWLKARADDRFLNNLSSIMKSVMLRQLAKEITIVGGIATVICFWNVVFIDGIDGFFGAHFDGLLYNFDAPLLKLPMEPFKWSSSSLSLLLVFRTNTAFRRWDEGRKAWGSIINSSRTAARLGTQWATPEADGAHSVKMKRLADAVWSFPRSLQYHMLGALEDGAAFAADVQKIQDKKFASDLMAVRHKPTRALKEITQVLTTINFPSVVYQVEAEKAVTTLCDALGACERIFTSPPPLFYSHHTSRFLVVWIFLLPFCLYEPFGGTWNHLGMIPASVLISYFMLGVEELAAQMEEPFSILPMEKMTGGIRLSADEHVEWKKFTAETIDRTIESFSTSNGGGDGGGKELGKAVNGFTNGEYDHLFSDDSSGSGSSTTTMTPNGDSNYDEMPLEPSYSFLGTRAIADDEDDDDDDYYYLEDDNNQIATMTTETKQEEEEEATIATTSDMIVTEYVAPTTSATTTTTTTPKGDSSGTSTTTNSGGIPPLVVPMKELDDDSFEAFLMRQAKNSK